MTDNRKQYKNVVLGPPAVNFNEDAAVDGRLVDIPTNEARLIDEHTKFLDEQVISRLRTIKSAPGTRVVIDAFASRKGDPEDNKRLSDRRAAAVKLHISRGIGDDFDGFEINSFGESRDVNPRVNDPNAPVTDDDSKFMRSVDVKLFVPQLLQPPPDVRESFERPNTLFFLTLVGKVTGGPIFLTGEAGLFRIGLSEHDPGPLFLYLGAGQGIGLDIGLLAKIKKIADLIKNAAKAGKALGKIFEELGGVKVGGKPQQFNSFFPRAVTDFHLQPAQIAQFLDAQIGTTQADDVVTDLKRVKLSEMLIGNCSPAKIEADFAIDITAIGGTSGLLIMVTGDPPPTKETKARLRAFGRIRR